MSAQIGLPRDVRAMTYLVSFLVTTVATELITRATLALSGFPQLGGSGLHIAHVVWGGLVLAVGVVVLLSFVGRSYGRWRWLSPASASSCSSTKWTSSSPVLGLRSLSRDRAGAYAWFVRALLVDLLLTQPIIVASDQFSQLSAVAIDLIMLAVVATAKAAAAADSTRASDPQAAGQPGPATVH